MRILKCKFGCIETNSYKKLSEHYLNHYLKDSEQERKNLQSHWNKK